MSDCKHNYEITEILIYGEGYKQASHTYIPMAYCPVCGENIGETGHVEDVLDIVFQITPLDKPLPFNIEPMITKRIEPEE